MSAAYDSTPQLDKYELLEELGHGGMATVYRAVDRRLGREVAVKIIHRHLRDEREVKERFVREARAVAKLRHPAIVEVYDVSEPEETERYLVVELVKGITLRRLLTMQSPLPPELVLGIGIAVAEALHHAHEQGVVHRDVKPENVLVALPESLRNEAESGQVMREFPSQASAGAVSKVSNSKLPPRSPVALKLTDFGIAKVLDVQGVTSTGEVLGSPAHMAPEQIEGQSVGPKADVFSLGVMLYEALVGSLPFHGTNPAQVLRRVLEGNFLPTERARPEVGALIGRVIDRALAHRPEDRFEDASAFARAMRVELERSRFREPMDELTRFLEEPSRYHERFVHELMPILVESARKARTAGDVSLSMALYNRALSLRPGDPSIVAEVGRLNRMRALRGRFWMAGVGLLVLGASATALYGFFGARRGLGRSDLGRSNLGRAIGAAQAAGVAVPPRPTEGRTQTPSGDSLGDKGGESRPESEALPAKGTLVASTDASLPRLTGKSSTGLHPLPGPTAGRPNATVGTRTVKIELRGAKGSRLLIDGVERPWFGAKHELDYGVHRFHVIAPTENCCIVPEPRVVKVGPGDGELRISMSVEFREAQLQLSAADGTTLTCGELFSGILESPGRRSVRLTQAETRASCTLIPPVDSGGRPRTVDVILRPGGTFTVTGT